MNGALFIYCIAIHGSQKRWSLFGNAGFVAEAAYWDQRTAFTRRIVVVSGNLRADVPVSNMTYLAIVDPAIIWVFMDDRRSYVYAALLLKSRDDRPDAARLLFAEVLSLTHKSIPTFLKITRLIKSI